MFHDLDENRRHYDRVSSDKRPLYFQRFDTQILDNNPIVAGLLTSAFQRMFPSPVGRLLDLGCGTGFYYPLLSRHAESVLGIDVSREMLDEAERLIADKQLTNCSVRECSALELDVADESIDVVHSWDFLHHVSDIPAALAEITRVLKPGGRFLAVEPNVINPSIAWYHMRRRSEWRLFLQNQFTLPRKIHRQFERTIRYDNTIISFLNERTHWIWKAANRLTSIKPFHLLSFRYMLDATKRS
ncbi:class I SAM-dependent methyltransferase [Stieleria varia]|uniref:class I SAM-dependent methyltransferase n=1 Tax=Stieleria varia TaxID=2528005 RepID=UPI0018D22B27|nr:class I SAM-dependent methyltransferase [Stieleria varia]